jgi:hypothetical protein
MADGGASKRERQVGIMKALPRANQDPFAFEHRLGAFCSLLIQQMEIRHRWEMYRVTRKSGFEIPFTWYRDFGVTGWEDAANHPQCRKRFKALITRIRKGIKKLPYTGPPKLSPVPGVLPAEPSVYKLIELPKKTIVRILNPRDCLTKICYSHKSKFSGGGKLVNAQGLIDIVFSKRLTHLEVTYKHLNEKKWSPAVLCQ